MRGMTWSGMFYNMVTSDPTPQSVNRIDRPDAAPIPEVSDTRQHYQNRSELLHGSTRQQGKDAEMEQLANTVSQLEGISLAINSSLKGQNDLTESMNTKTEEVHTLALAAVLKSAQLTQRAKNSPEIEMGSFYFVHPATRHYLSVNGTSLVMSPVFDRAAVFRVFCKESHLMAIQSCKTFKYVGVTMWGTVSVSSNYFGSYEEMFVDLDGFRNTPGILMLVSNWGGGGWLQTPVEDAEGRALVSTVTKDISDSTKKLLLQSKAMSDEDFRRISATEK
jgi:hypothetical protein